MFPLGSAPAEKLKTNELQHDLLTAGCKISRAFAFHKIIAICVEIHGR